jgi:hypothetical protein
VQRKKTKQTLKTHAEKDGPEWLVFFYSVPAKPAGCRVKIWRRLSKAGAVQFKGSVYILPHNEENHEFFSWLVSEVKAMNGEAAFLRGEKFETSKEQEIIDLFNRQRDKEYRKIEKCADSIEGIVSSFKKGTKVQKETKLNERFSRLVRNFEEIQRIDFFMSEAGLKMKHKIKVLEKEIRNAAASETKSAVTVKIQNKKDYQGRTWVTRKKPFVDRIASAWLIKGFIDKKAGFDFIDEREMDSVKDGAVTFDMGGGNFTHIGDMCTFEVLLKSFRIKEGTLKKISEIVHQIDLRDDRFLIPESKGIEEVLAGIRKTGESDQEILEKGMGIFEMLYASKTC